MAILLGILAEILRERGRRIEKDTCKAASVDIWPCGSYGSTPP